MNRFLRFSFFAFTILVAIIFANSCANIIPPTGGPRDSLPPVLVMALPKDSSLNFKTNKIVLTFDEYVELDNNLNEQLVVSPNPVNMPIIQGKLKTVTISLKDSLQPNTTYSINFGNALRDIDEQNVLKNFTYIFSTGNKLDDGTISGNVILAETGKTDSTLIVVLHKNLSDTAVKKLKPEYFAHLDGKGNFEFKYLPYGEFNMYVLPNDYSKKYDDSTKVFAFLNKPVSISESSESITLYAYQQFKEKEKTTANNSTEQTDTKNNAQQKSVRFTTSQESNRQDLLSPLTFTFTKKIKQFDSSKIVLFDTNYKPLNNYNFSFDTSFTKLSMQYTWQEQQFFKLIIQKDAVADSAGNTLFKNDTLNFQTKKESEYGSMRLHFNNIDLSTNPVLLLIQNDAIVQSVVLTSNEWYQRLFRPGEYELRILFDDNKNGKWDAGNFLLKQQPEKVSLIPRKLSAKSNWDNEVDINL